MKNATSIVLGNIKAVDMLTPLQAIKAAPPFKNKRRGEYDLRKLLAAGSTLARRRLVKIINATVLCNYFSIVAYHVAYSTLDF